jgi:DNA-binding transcriptional ArsR family regulator
MRLSPFVAANCPAPTSSGKVAISTNLELSGLKIVELPCNVNVISIVCREKEKRRKMSKNTEIQQPSRDEISLARVLYALSDPIRMEIVLKIVSAGQVACGAFNIPMPKSTLSHHFKVLRESGVVASRREGNELMNSLRFADLEARFPGLIKAIIAAGS